MGKLTTISSIAVIVLLTAPAAAQQKRKPAESSSQQYDSQWSQGRSRSDADSFSSGRRRDSKDDIDGRAFDPGGDYGNYPGWARKALGGSKDPG